MEIKSLQTIKEVLHYGSLGEVTISSSEDWRYIANIITEHLAFVEAELADSEDEITSDDVDDSWDSGYELGREEGYTACMQDYNLKEK